MPTGEELLAQYGGATPTPQTASTGETLIAKYSASAATGPGTEERATQGPESIGRYAPERTPDQPQPEPIEPILTNEGGLLTEATPPKTTPEPGLTGPGGALSPEAVATGAGQFLGSYGGPIGETLIPALTAPIGRAWELAHDTNDTQLTTGQWAEELAAASERGGIAGFVGVGIGSFLRNTAALGSVITEALAPPLKTALAPLVSAVRGLRKIAVPDEEAALREAMSKTVQRVAADNNITLVAGSAGGSPVATAIGKSMGAALPGPFVKAVDKMERDISDVVLDHASKSIPEQAPQIGDTVFTNRDPLAGPAFQAHETRVPATITKVNPDGTFEVRYEKTELRPAYRLKGVSRDQLFYPEGIQGDINKVQAGMESRMVEARKGAYEANTRLFQNARAALADPTEGQATAHLNDAAKGLAAQGGGVRPFQTRAELKASSLAATLQPPQQKVLADWFAKNPNGLPPLRDISDMANIPPRLFKEFNLPTNPKTKAEIQQVEAFMKTMNEIDNQLLPHQALTPDLIPSHFAAANGLDRSVPKSYDELLDIHQRTRDLASSAYRRGDSDTGRQFAEMSISALRDIVEIGKKNPAILPLLQQAKNGYVDTIVNDFIKSGAPRIIENQKGRGLVHALFGAEADPITIAKAQKIMTPGVWEQGMKAELQASAAEASIVDPQTGASRISLPRWLAKWDNYPRATLEAMADTPGLGPKWLRTFDDMRDLVRRGAIYSSNHTPFKDASHQISTKIQIFGGIGLGAQLTYQGLTGQDPSRTQVSTAFLLASPSLLGRAMANPEAFAALVQTMKAGVGTAAARIAAQRLAAKIAASPPTPNLVSNPQDEMARPERGVPVEMPE